MYKIEFSQKAQKQFDIPVTLPALIRSQKIGAATRKHKFDWDKVSQVITKVDEELSELKVAIDRGDIGNQQHELGDLLFTAVQLARHLNFDAEQSLRQANQRFELRFSKMQELCENKGCKLVDLSSEELEDLWDQSKKSVG